MRKMLFLLVAGILSYGVLPAQPLQVNKILQAAEIYMHQKSPDLVLAGHEILMNDEMDSVGYLCRFHPSGFMILSASPRINPVYAWSLSGSLPTEPAGDTLYRKLVSYDLHARITASAGYTETYSREVKRKWTLFLNGLQDSVPFQQWPPEGTTLTEGWLETNWKQTAPYNAMCPLDLNAGSRSIAGCPAIAMAQIVNYHRDINQTRFNNGDDYYHSYGAGNQYMIDDDYLSRGFPCFDTLNIWLEDLEAIYLVNGTPENNHYAALCFACGVAAQQVYTASVSGTFGLEQAEMAYHRFGYNECHLVYPEDTTLNAQIAGNVKAALPVHLGLLVSTGSGGHNVVVDGYNTDEFYHFNFGWGGPSNGWYTIPPTVIPYNLTIVESAVLDIKSDLYTGTDPRNNVERQNVIGPNPFKEELMVRGISKPAVINILDAYGHIVLAKMIAGEQERIGTGALLPGIYFYRITGQNGEVHAGKLIKR